VRPLAVIGSLARDLVEGQPPRVGGAPFYAARALRRLGRPARIVTRCAEEDRAELLPRLVALGVPVSWRAAAPTPAFSFRYDGDRRMMEVVAVGPPWGAGEARGWVADALARAEWLHVAPLLRSDFDAGALAALAEGRRLSLDGQGLVRVARTGPLRLDPDFDPGLLRHVSILKLAEEEAAVLVGEPDEAALRSLGVPEVIVTLGSRGSLVLAGGALEHVPARAVRGEVDPTGAGDAFAAAYLTGRSAGRSPRASARRASALVAGLLGGRVR
jgi:sugar/nucleoside kinase (ribokinase family)